MQTSSALRAKIAWIASGGDSIAHSSFQAPVRSTSKNSGSTPLSQSWIADARANRKPAVADKIPPPKPPRTYEYYIPSPVVDHPQSFRTLSPVLEKDEEEDSEIDLRRFHTLGNLNQLTSSSSQEDDPFQSVPVCPSADDVDLTCVSDVPPIRPPRGIKKFKENKIKVESVVAPEVQPTKSLRVESTESQEMEPFGQLDYSLTFHWTMPTPQVRCQNQVAVRHF